MDFAKETLLLAITAPFLLGAIIFEVLWTHFRHIRAYTLRETLTNGYLAALNGSLDVLLRGFVLWLLGLAFAVRLAEWERGWVYWTALFFAEDFAYYALHYVDHRCRFFWAAHVTHHSSEEFNLTTGFRSSVFQPLYRVVYFLPLAWLGFRPIDILFMYAATQIYGSFVHTERIRKLGWLEWVLVTPSHHRVHHASNPRYLDKNMGMCLIIWDRLFGTFAAEDPAEPARYGLTYKLTERGPVKIVFHEWIALFRDIRSARNWRERLGYLLHRPGWQPVERRQ